LIDIWHCIVTLCKMRLFTSLSSTSTLLSPQERTVQDQYVALFLRQNQRAQAGILLCVVVLFLLLTLRVNLLWPLAWLGVMSLFAVVRITLTARWVERAESPLTVLSSLMLLSGLGLAAPLLAFGSQTDVDRAAVSTLLIAVATASVSSTSGYRSIFLWFAGPILLSLSAAWVLASRPGESQQVGWGIGGLLVVYLAYLWTLGRDAFRIFDESCRIRFAETELNARMLEALAIAEQASQSKTRFLAAASHDLRQPLHTVGVLVAALSLRALDKRSGEIVQMLGSVSQSLSGQLDGLLDVSRLDAGIVKPELRVEAIDEIVRTHVAAIETTANQKGLTLRFHSDGRVEAQTDANLLRRILGNLTGNALKFTASGGVDVSVRRHRKQTIIEVVDTGIGIAPEFQQLVFQEFYQVENSERDRSKGLGLGLSIVQRLCGLLDMQLGLQSVPGQGTRFTLKFDALESQATSTPVADSPLVELGCVRVLVVDDELAVREGMRVLLEELGCQVLLADGAAQAAHHAQGGALDMVISDFRLKDRSDGLDVIHQCQTIQPSLYALLISGDTAPERLRQAHAAQVPMLHKPVALDELLNHIQLAKQPTQSHDFI
jgi:signal transduction histidine kinase/CheY-like chemotaxis protein